VVPLHHLCEDGVLPSLLANLMVVDPLVTKDQAVPSTPNVLQSRRFENITSNIVVESGFFNTLT